MLIEFTHLGKLRLGRIDIALLRKLGSRGQQLIRLRLKRVLAVSDRLQHFSKQPVHVLTGPYALGLDVLQEFARTLVFLASERRFRLLIRRRKLAKLLRHSRQRPPQRAVAPPSQVRLQRNRLLQLRLGLRVVLRLVGRHAGLVMALGRAHAGPGQLA